MTAERYEFLDLAFISILCANPGIISLYAAWITTYVQSLLRVGLSAGGDYPQSHQASSFTPTPTPTPSNTGYYPILINYLSMWPVSTPWHNQSTNTHDHRGYRCELPHSLLALSTPSRYYCPVHSRRALGNDQSCTYHKPFIFIPSNNPT